MANSEVGMRDALAVLRSRIELVRLPFATSEVEAAVQARREMLAQLDDYVLPRLSQATAPVLMVVGGSTGAGKSTLVNSIVRAKVSKPGVLRPTTRFPVLIHHPDDVRWFDERRVLPEFPRSNGDGSEGLTLVSSTALPPGLAILDAPDIDSVVTENHVLAQQLLAAADLWMFVTTAARYSDAVPWQRLAEAADRSTAVSVVLDRVPAEAVDEVRIDLARMLSHHGLGDAPLFIVPEIDLDDGMVPLDVVTPIGAWLHALAADEQARTRVVARTLEGAVSGLVRKAPIVAAAADDQVYAAEKLNTLAVDIYESARTRTAAATGDGTLLRGEVLTRWQDVVRTVESARPLATPRGKLRGTIRALFRGRPVSTEPIEAAIERGVRSLVLDEIASAAEKADAAWRADPAGRELIGSEDLSRPTSDLAQRTTTAVRAWQDAIREFVRAEAGDASSVQSSEVRGLGVALMMVVLGSHADTKGDDANRESVGTEAGANAVAVGQKALGVAFSDQAVRQLTDRARKDLGNRLEELFVAESRQFTHRLDKVPVDAEAGQGVRTAASDVLVVKHGYPVPADDHHGLADDHVELAEEAEVELANEAEVIDDEPIDDPEPPGDSDPTDDADTTGDTHATDDTDARSEAGH